MITILSRQCEEPLKTHDFRDLRVGVQAVKRVSPFGERREQRLVREAPGERQVLRVAAQRRYVREHLVHAAVLGREHALKLFVGHRRCHRGRPVRELRQDLERLSVAGVEVRVAQTAQDLVHRVPGHADELPASHRVLELRSSVRERADEPTPRLRLTRLQLGHDVVGALLHARIVRGRVHQ